MLPESSERASDPVSTGFSGLGRRFLKRSGRRSRTLSLHGVHDLAEMVGVRYRILLGDPKRVAALIPTAAGCLSLIGAIISFGARRSG